MTCLITDAYLDMDGVLAALRETIERMHPALARRIFVPWHSASPEQRESRNMAWHELCSIDGFWLSIPALEGSDLLVECLAATGVRLHVLTATPRALVDTDPTLALSAYVAAQKKQWIESRWPNLFESFNAPNHAALKKHLSAPGRLLIDDLTENCSAWESEGGLAIQHTGCLSTIERLDRFSFRRFASSDNTDGKPSSANGAFPAGRPTSNT